MTQKISKRAVPSGEGPHRAPGALPPQIPNLEERVALILGAYLAAASFVLTVYPETRHCMLRLTESVGAGTVPLYLFLRFSGGKALVFVATALAVITPWLLN